MSVLSKVIGLLLSTHSCRLATGLIAAIRDAMIVKFCGVKREGDRRITICPFRLTGDLGQVFWT